MSVIVKNLTKKYENQLAVNNISFEAKQGEILGFLGPNGAGKSTTMKIATCFVPPTSGTIEVGGLDVRTHSKEVRRMIGYLPEHNPLYLDLYVREYLEFVGSVFDLKSTFLKNRISEMVEMCGLTREQNKKIGSLSKGYRQRVGLAQALLHDPKILILDEPTTGLDPNQLVEIRNLIKKVSAEKTVIFSTHIMQEVQALCDKVVIINKGNLVANESVASLRSSESAVSFEIQLTEKVSLDIFRSITHVSDAKELDQNRYVILVENGQDIRNDLFDLVKSHNWNLLELKKLENSLEQIFRNLTKQ